MREVFIGYGEFKDYRLVEVPRPFLDELSNRFPLKAESHEGSDWRELFITVAIHGEIARRHKGGTQEKHRPTKRRMAEGIITKGFHQLSKTYHPDSNGDNESQKVLTSARDFLQATCRNIEEDYDNDKIIIADPSAGTEITDEDIPF